MAAKHSLSPRGHPLAEPHYPELMIDQQLVEIGPYWLRRASWRPLTTRELEALQLALVSPRALTICALWSAAEAGEL